MSKKHMLRCDAKIINDEGRCAGAEYGTGCRIKKLQCEGGSVVARRNPPVWTIHRIKKGSTPTKANQLSTARNARDARRQMKLVAPKA